MDLLYNKNKRESDKVETSGKEGIRSSIPLFIGPNLPLVVYLSLSSLTTVGKMNIRKKVSGLTNLT